MKGLIGGLFKKIEENPLDFKKWLLGFTVIIIIRILFESLALSNWTGEKPIAILALITQTYLFFLFAYLVFLIFLNYITKEDIKKTANILLWGFWIVVFPPLIDKIIFQDKPFWSFYLYGGLGDLLKKFFQFFGDNYSIGITYGVRIEIALAVFLVAIYVYYKKKSFLKALASLVGGYFVFYVLASLPSFLAIIIEFFKGKNIFDVTHGDVAGIFNSPFYIFSTLIGEAKSFLSLKMNLFFSIFIFFALIFLQYKLDRKKIVIFFKNIRFPQMFYNWGIFFIGIALGWYYFPKNLQQIDVFSVLAVINLVLGIFCAWICSIFINDLTDRKIDEITNQSRPLPQKSISEEDHKKFSLIFFLLSLVFSIAVGFKFFLLMLAYNSLTWAYSAYPFRLKRFLGVASFLSAMASLVFLFMGYLLVSDQQSFVNFPWNIFWLLVLTYTVCIPIKDLKDIEGDKKEGVMTLPALLGWRKSKIIIASLVLVSFFLSVFVLKEKELLFYAFIFGTTSFWVILNDKIPLKYLNWAILTIVAIYGLLLTKIIFF